MSVADRDPASRPPRSAPIRCRTGWSPRPPSRRSIDATRVVIDTQEQAGIDLVCDGELYRFDVNHPETNGMIEYFVRPMAGVRSEIGFAEWLAFKNGAGMSSAAVRRAWSTAPIGAGHARSAGRLRAREDARRRGRSKFTLTGPHMLAKTLLDTHYKDKAALAHGDRRRAGRAGEAHRRRRDPGRRGQPARAPRTNGNGPRRR